MDGSMRASIFSDSTCDCSTSRDVRESWRLLRVSPTILQGGHVGW
jgi:hypothetical protein